MSLLKLKVPAHDLSGEDPRPPPGSPSAECSETVALEERRADSLQPTPEQIRYAGVLEKVARLGLLCLLVTFLLYAFGIVEPRIPIDRVCECWKLDAHQYRSAAGIERGWHWVSLLGYGDFLNFLGIILLAGATVLCYIAVIPLLLKRNDMLYTVLALLQILVLLFAASGVIAVGH